MSGLERACAQGHAPIERPASAPFLLHQAKTAALMIVNSYRCEIGGGIQACHLLIVRGHRIFVSSNPLLVTAKKIGRLRTIMSASLGERTPADQPGEGIGPNPCERTPPLLWKKGARDIRFKQVRTSTEQMEGI